LREEEILRLGLFFALIISIAFSLIVIPTFSAAQIWTEDEQGNLENDFAPDDNVYIRGSGFGQNAQIDITITRPGNVVENRSTFSDENGCFLYIYTLDGENGTYYVTATDGVNSANTTFEDSQAILEGYDKAAARWERGLLEGWRELDWVPYRIKFWLPEGTSNYNFNIYHNNLLDNKLGVDRVRNFRVGDLNGNPVDGSVTFSGPFYKTPGKDCDRDIYYSLSVTFNVPSWGTRWFVYWDAHLAIGSSAWPGARLHAYSGITGCQDVPIKVPPVPLGSISGWKWNDLSYDGVWNAGEPGLSGWTIQLYFFDPVENTWNNIDNEDTGAGGNYTFSGLVAGNYRVTEVLKENWRQTYPPSPGIHSITLSEGENRTGVNFGNILIIHGVEVSVSPSYQSGSNGQTLNYTVTVANTGNVSDTYDLNVSDDLGWALSVYPTWLTVPAGENRTATLSAMVPNKAMGCTEDNIIVTATSREDTVSDSASCIAHVAIVRGVEVSISPQENGAEPCNTLEYTVTVRNTGNVAGNFDLSWADIEGWGGIWLKDNSLWAARGGENSTTLYVHIPGDAEGGTWNNITVTATSREDANVRDNDTCRARVDIVRGVDVTISPEYQSGKPGDNLSYTITVTNTGNVQDNYSLENMDTLGWPLSLSRFLIEVPAGGNQTTTLTVRIPDNARGCTEDNITVIATSQADNTVKDSTSCTALVENVYRVSVSISPDYQSGPPGSTLAYIVMVKNVGNVADSYTLVAWDIAGWLGPWTQELIDVPPGENRTKPLNVIIPDNAVPCTRDNIVVSATSHADNRVSAENSAIAHAAFVRGVDVSISPIVDNSLIRDVIVTNTGNAVDSFSLIARDNLGWRLMLAENMFGNVMPGENRRTTLRVKIPENAKSGTLSGITVTATSQEDENVSDTASAQVSAIRSVEVSIYPTINGGASGARLIYTVTVTNTGNVSDNYVVTKTDVLGWIVTENFAWLSLEPQHSDSVNFDVIIPQPVQPGLEDLITITATSLIENEVTVSDNATCIAAGPNLLAGWNLISFWKVSENDTPNNLFASYPILHVMYTWEAPYGPYSEPDYNQPVQLGVGYWVYVNESVYIRTTGEPVENFTLELVAGWNLVGFPVTSENTTPNNLFAGLTYTMYYWQAPYGPYSEPDYNQPVQLGVGYWVRVDQDVTITVPL
jgi:uncharacterized repeat protein (TIGR01451 family)